jgi:hypothetical protein
VLHSFGGLAPEQITGNVQRLKNEGLYDHFDWTVPRIVMTAGL